MGKHVAVAWTHAQGVRLKSAVAYYKLIAELDSCGCQYLAEVMDDAECPKSELGEIAIADEYWGSYE